MSRKVLELLYFCNIEPITKQKVFLFYTLIYV